MRTSWWMDMSRSIGTTSLKASISNGRCLWRPFLFHGLQSSRCLLHAKRTCERVYREREHLGSSRSASIFLLAYIVFSHQTFWVFTRACIILHNITIDDEYWGAYDVDDYEIVWSFVAALSITLNTQALPPSFTNRHPLREVTIYVSSVHNQLQNNLIDHI